jgi:hypothetical protein
VGWKAGEGWWDREDREEDAEEAEEAAAGGEEAIPRDGKDDRAEAALTGEPFGKTLLLWLLAARGNNDPPPNSALWRMLARKGVRGAPVAAMRP